MMPQNCNILLN